VIVGWITCMDCPGTEDRIRKALAENPDIILRPQISKILDEP
jgi:hypothetical protein